MLREFYGTRRRRSLIRGFLAAHPVKLDVLRPVIRELSTVNLPFQGLEIAAFILITACLEGSVSPVNRFAAIAHPEIDFTSKLVQWRARQPL